MLKEGIILGERYEIMSRIGTGGMADVYKAQDLKLNRLVAVKVMKAEFREDTSFVAKFQKEAQAAAKLSHPNVVNVYDVGEDRGLYYIVMELIEGITLKNYIAKKGKLSVKEATSIAIQVSLGLEAAHNRGIIHRDVKPQNIIISTDGKVKLSDFGIAKAINSNTITANVMGSVHYSSPEQVRGGFSDAKSDIYSLGITMYEMVTGRVPFDGDTTVAIAIKHLQEEIVPPSIYTPDLPYSLEQIILKCTQKNPERRYQSSGDLIEDLKHSLIEPQGNFVAIAPLASHAESVSGGSVQEGRRYVQDPRAEQRRRSREDEYEERRRRMAEEDDEDDDEDDEPSSGLEKAVTIGGFLIGAVIIIILILLIGNMTGLFDLFGKKKDKDTSAASSSAVVTEAPVQEEEEEVEQIAVPDLRGKTLDEAAAIVNPQGLGVKQVGTDVSDDYASGQIMSQNYPEGTMVAPNTMIEVMVSSGLANVTIPTGMENMSQSDAEAQLENLGLVTSIELQYSDSIAVGNVIGTNPAGGSSVPAASTVTIYISKGQNDTDSLKVPDLIGQDEESAKATLDLMGLSYTMRTATDENYDDGVVIDESPAIGDSIVKGSIVTLTINSLPQEAKKPDGKYVCYSPLSRPDGYKGGKVKLELVQGETKTTIYEGDDPWKDGTYNTPIASDLAETGVINVYEDGTLIAKYPNVKFEKA